MRGHSSARGRSHHWRFTALVVAAAFTFGCAATGQFTVAFGKKAQARIWKPDYGEKCLSPDDKQDIKTTVHTIDRTIGADEKIVTTEPASPPVVAESRGGEPPELAWYAALWCFVSPTC